jgi:hypothetical protein
MPISARTVVDRANDLRIKGVTSQAGTTRETPAQAELHPTCAGPSRVNLLLILAFWDLLWIASGAGHPARTEPRPTWASPYLPAAQYLPRGMPTASPCATRGDVGLTNRIARMINPL